MFQIPSQSMWWGPGHCLSWVKQSLPSTARVASWSATRGIRRWRKRRCWDLSFSKKVFLYLECTTKHSSWHAVCTATKASSFQCRPAPWWLSWPNFVSIRALVLSTQTLKDTKSTTSYFHVLHILIAHGKRVRIKCATVKMCFVFLRFWDRSAIRQHAIIFVWKLDVLDNISNSAPSDGAGFEGTKKKWLRKKSIVTWRCRETAQNRSGIWVPNWRQE